MGSLFATYIHRGNRMKQQFLQSLAHFLGLCVSSVIFSLPAQAEEKVTPANETIVGEQLALEQTAIEQQLAVEQQKQMEQAKLDKQIADIQALDAKFASLPLLFKDKIAQIYADNGYQVLWNDAGSVKQFLRNYSALAVTGISTVGLSQLEKIDAQPEGSLERDLLLTDAFLDYLFYAKNLNKFAQKWLYDKRSYPTTVPSDELVDTWLSAVKNGKNTDFINSLVARNHLYHQTFAKLPTLLADNSEKAQAAFYKMAMNVQRLRVLPEFDDGLFVNIPSYTLHYYRDGQLVLDSRVIVGKKARKTPVMYSKLSNVVVNPPWNAPVRLINEDIIPKVRKDPSYIYRNGYTIIDSKGKIIDPYTIDWENMTAKKFPYRLRQVPGDSALGNFKFNMPSSDAIYLHDTPNHSYFAKKDRALSSGCVRVEKSNQLATILLKESGWTEERKNNTLKSRKTVSVNISSNNPVFLYYVTNWIENGKEYHLPDIYGYDVKADLSRINWELVRKYLK